MVDVAVFLISKTGLLSKQNKKYMYRAFCHTHNPFSECPIIQITAVHLQDFVSRKRF